MEVNFPFSLRLESMPDDTNRVAVFYGPIVLAGDLGDENDSLAFSPMYVPVLQTEIRDPNQWLKPVERKINSFKMQNVGQPRDVEMNPLYSTHNRSYSVYFDIFSKEGWKIFQEKYQKELA